jgi:hypothetical protein
MNDEGSNQMATETTRAGDTPGAADGDGDTGTEPREPRSERARILGMVSEGKITVDEAEQLLRALDPPDAPPQPGWPPRGPFFNVPVPPVPPIPPMAPIPPIPPVPPMPHIASGPMDVIAHGPFAMASGGRRGRKRRSLKFEFSEGSEHASCVLPLELAKSADRFVPRKIREILEEHEVDLNQLLEVVRAYGDDAEEGLTLVDLGEGGFCFEITLE